MPTETEIVFERYWVEEKNIALDAIVPTNLTRDQLAENLKIIMRTAWLSGGNHILRQQNAELEKKINAVPDDGE